ncbi:alpha/beta hydrolase-fold protein [Colwellia sp. E2M01]|uniref:alpha/beta hydrolase n=1 Tax=Colwellia sp. E2M01 TaxID=2841561 RepID=UPI001C086835|nr:alpha/beta hydrolase-fold protein [Colwellia sp. E2M01]MBU2872083.1 alpha/beta fold hydrolase [Colwellia sp. E2M01]
MAILRVEKSNPEYTPANTTTLTLYSSNIGGRQDISVYHSGKQTEHTPIIVLLHGVYGSNWVWMQLGGVEKVYEQLKQEGLNDFVLVMPSDGGLWDGSAYLPLSEQGNYEAWIVDDVINGVIDNIDGVSQQSNVYITGLSMGGYGALRLGAKYPTQFKGISAHSSVTSLDDLQQFTDTPVANYQCDFENEADITYWLKKNKDTLPPLRFDCGKDDTLFESNLVLCSAMDKLNINYQFESLSGTHEWAYWHENIVKTFNFFNSIELNSN